MTYQLPEAHKTPLSAARGKYADSAVYLMEGRAGLWRRTRKSGRKVKLAAGGESVAAVIRGAQTTVHDFVLDDLLTAATLPAFPVCGTEEAA